MNKFIILTLITIVSGDYWSDRAKLIDLDASQAVGSSIVLTDKEKQVNDVLMNYKLKEYDEGFKNPVTFLPSLHFFKSKLQVEQSEVFKFIQKVPKGASLHSHDTALVSFEYVYNLTYKENLYGCIVDERLALHFFDKNVDSTCQWKLIKDMRQENASFDDFVESQLTIIVDDPVKTYPSINDVWTRFLQTFGTVNGMVTYRPVFEDYFYQALKELYEDNVMYLEFRSVIPEIYELDGTIYGPEDVVKIYLDTLNHFKQDYPDFYGARIIFAPSRNVDNKTVDNYVTLAIKLKELYPDFVAGFDLVGQEDKGKPLIDFITQLLEIDKNNIKFFFHAAETNWDGASTDMNLFDAVLLNTTRIGHGFGIVKHPKILEEVMNRNIAIEISPLSNQVLKLVDDLRNHPGAFLINSGYPVVITCDDPSFWGAKALSYDWYMAFMAFASRENDLKLLKRLAVNSLIYSAMNEDEKCDAFNKWEDQWNKFLDEILSENALR